MSVRCFLTLAVIVAQAAVPLATILTCHTAVPGEECYELVTWARENGIVTRPDWYPGLTENSTLLEFQQFLYERRELVCSPPCPEEQGVCCCVATNGTECHSEVLFAMTDLIHSNPEWYPGLTPTSGFVEFQSILAGREPFSCEMPCAGEANGATDVAGKSVQLLLALALIMVLRLV